jgi:protein gp37
MQKTKIEYLDYTWNPIAMKCTPVSDGCQNCWHLAMAKRLAKNPLICLDERLAYGNGAPLLKHRELKAPIHLRKPSRIGVQFMGDLFHEDVEGFWIGAILKTIEHCSRHTFMILTKRPERMKRVFDLIEKGLKEYIQSPNWPFKNLWLGVSVEDQKTADERIPILLQIPAAKRFVSVEPMLGPVKLIYWVWDYPFSLKEQPKNIGWVIAGGETGPHARPLHPDWVRSLRDQCQAAGVPFFLKQIHQWGCRKCGFDPCTHLSGHTRKLYLTRLLDGKIWEEFGI